MGHFGITAVFLKVEELLSSSLSLQELDLNPQLTRRIFPKRLRLQSALPCCTIDSQLMCFLLKIIHFHSTAEVAAFLSLRSVYM